MATRAAARLIQMADNVSGILAIELLAACQGVEFHAPLTTSALLQGVLADLRAKVPPYDKDRFFAPDIEAAKGIVSSGLGADLRTDLLPGHAA